MVASCSMVSFAPTSQPLTVSDRWYLQSLAASAADFSPGWLALLDQQPGENDSLSVYAEWVAQILTQIGIESAVIQMDISELAERQTELEAMYEDTFSNSYGLKEISVLLASYGAGIIILYFIL